MTDADADWRMEMTASMARLETRIIELDRMVARQDETLARLRELLVLVLEKLQP